VPVTPTGDEPGKRGAHTPNACSGGSRTALRRGEGEGHGRCGHEGGSSREERSLLVDDCALALAASPAALAGYRGGPGQPGVSTEDRFSASLVSRLDEEH
jgi:hypothetical protein